jgi:hypothetical protein
VDRIELAQNSTAGLTGHQAEGSQKAQEFGGGGAGWGGGRRNKIFLRTYVFNK